MKARVASLAILLLGCLATPVRAQLVARLVDAVDANERADHIDISIIFGCSLRYLSHAPASEGDSVRLRFTALPDCGNLAGALSSLPPLDAVKGAVRSIEAEELA